MTQNSTESRMGFLGFLVREGTALVFAGLVWMAIWGGYAPVPNTAEQGFTSALVIGLIALGYVGVQAFAVVTAPLARETRYLLDLLLSLIPLALIAYAVVETLIGEMSPTLFQRGVLWFAGVACLIDVIIFTWFNMKLNKLASDFVQMR